MSDMLKKYGKYFLLALLVVALDHFLKLWVHFNMEYGEERNLFGEWGKLHYVLNNGIAYGIEMDFPYGKFALSLVRTIAVFVIAYMIVYLGKKGAHKGLLWTMGLILGGALGNMLDSVFYGMWLENNLAYNAPFAVFHGRVIDMLYFPIIHGTFPEWFPFWAGESFEFFKPIFNLADSAISISFVILLIRQKAFFASISKDEKDAKQKAKDAAETELAEGEKPLDQTSVEAGKGEGNKLSSEAETENG